MSAPAARLQAVTGASGHVGGNLTRILLERGFNVRAIDLRKSTALEGLEVEFVQADVRDAAAMARALQGVDVLYHLAGIISITGDPTGLVRSVNVEGPRATAQAALAAGVHRVVHTSSVHAFDLESDAVVNESTAPAAGRGVPAYNLTKAAGEVEIRRAVKSGLDAVIVNPTGMIGPYDFEPSRMGQLFLALQAGSLPGLVEGGFDWVDVRDVCQSMIAAAETGRTGERYLLGGHHALVRELAEMAAKVTATPAPRRTAPLWIAEAWAPVGTVISRWTGNPLSFTADSLYTLRHHPEVDASKAKAELGHSARPLSESIDDIYAWFAGSNEKGVPVPAGTP